jgi:hypothetical protein
VSQSVYQQQLVRAGESCSLSDRRQDRRDRLYAVSSGDASYVDRAGE